MQSNAVDSVNGKTGVVELDTSDVTEVTNLYYTESRVSANSSVSANTAKVTNATHTGDATGDTALTLATVNSNIGSFNNPNMIVNEKGLVTAIVSNPVAYGDLYQSVEGTQKIKNTPELIEFDSTGLSVNVIDS